MSDNQDLESGMEIPESGISTSSSRVSQIPMYDLEDIFRLMVKDRHYSAGSKGKEIPESGISLSSSRVSQTPRYDPETESILRYISSKRSSGGHCSAGSNDMEIPESGISPFSQMPMADLLTVFRYIGIGGHYGAGSKGMEIPESGSIQMKNPVDTCHSETDHDMGMGFYEDGVDVAERHRKARKADAESFRREYIFGSSMEQRTCIGSHGTYSWSDQTSGIMWVGVHGMDSICVVTRTGDVDTKRLRGRLQKFYRYERTIRCFRKSIISEIEDLPETLHQIYGQRIEKPFCVVSTIPDSKEVHEESATIPDSKEVHEESAHEASSDDYYMKFAMLQLDNFLKEVAASGASKHDEENAKSAKHDEKQAIEFLEKKTKSDLAFTVDETIQTAISAFQHLFQKKFKGNEIEVSVLDPNYKIYVWEVGYKDVHVKELEIHEIEEHLAVVNEPGCLGSGSGSGGDHL